MQFSRLLVLPASLHASSLHALPGTPVLTRLLCASKDSDGRRGYSNRLPGRPHHHHLPLPELVDGWQTKVAKEGYQQHHLQQCSPYNVEGATPTHPHIATALYSLTKVCVLWFESLNRSDNLNRWHNDMCEKRTAIHSYKSCLLIWTFQPHNVKHNGAQFNWAW